MGIGARKKKPTSRKKPTKRANPKERLRPVSLFPLDFDTAVLGLLAAGSPQNVENKGSATV
jgi:hypothetical protein